MATSLIKHRFEVAIEPSDGSPVQVVEIPEWASAIDVPVQSNGGVIRLTIRPLPPTTEQAMHAEIHRLLGRAGEPVAINCGWC